MARIPEDELERIKRDTDLVKLVQSRGIELKKHGYRNYIGRCPFHEDEEPSLIITPAKGLYHCMGCGSAGNAIQFVQKHDGVSFRHAFEILSEGRGLLVESSGPIKRSSTPRLESPITDTAGMEEAINQALDYYSERLFKSPNALKYLERRGVRDDVTLDGFKIGFSDRTLGLRLPDGNRKEGERIRGLLKQSGVYRENGREHFRGCIVMPVTDQNGEVVEIYGRRIKLTGRKDTVKHLYLPGPHAGIWNREALEQDEIILCEAPLDALTYYVNGMRNVTFIFGTEGFPDYLLQAFVDRKVKRVLLAYDADKAGNRAAERDAQRLASHGIEARRVRFPPGQDVNSYACESSEPDKALATINAASEWMPGSVDAPRADAPALNSNKIAANIVAMPSPPAPLPEGEGSVIPPTVLDIAKQESAANKKRVLPDLVRRGEYHTMRQGKRDYRIGGLDRNNSLEVMKVSLRINYGEHFHLDSFDMTRDSDRRRFIERAAEETGLERDLLKKDLGRLLLALEDAQYQRLTVAVEPADKQPLMTDEERAEALEFLRSPNLVERITESFETVGLVGEESNRLAAYLACTSRKLERPLAVIIQSTSAAGKSTLMDAVLSMFPEEESVKYSAMTGQSLYYLGETNLKHNILAIVEEEGAEKASYALKLLQSEGQLTIASTGKDATSGRMETQEYHVEGPVMIFLTTTAIDIDEELQNRCLTLAVDESREQTERIHALQRQGRTLEGLKLRKGKRRLLNLLRNVQRLLQPVDVVNPYAGQLTFTVSRTRTRRDHEKYLTLIDVIALLHQHQRKRHKVEEGAEYIRVSPNDIELANRLASELLGRSLDELPPQTRRMYEAVKEIVKARSESEEVEQRYALFSRREIREHLGWSVTQTRVHLERLRQLEYVAARFGKTGSAFQYELLTERDGDNGVERIGLLDVKNLRVRQQPDGKNENLTGG